MEQAIGTGQSHSEIRNLDTVRYSSVCRQCRCGVVSGIQAKA